MIVTAAERQGVIYALTDKRSGEMRYVGKTVQGIQERFMSHMRDGSDLYKARWIRSIGKENVGCVTLEAGINASDLDHAERTWIARLREGGHRLTNMTEGGEGAPHTQESRAKIARAFRGVPKSEAQRKAMAVARRRWHESHTPEERSEVARKGRATLTAEARSEIARKGRASLSPAQRSQIARRGQATLREQRQRDWVAIEW